MKRLFVIRHAQAERGAPGTPDIARELSAEGRAEAEQAAPAFAEKHPNIDLIITSNATRAQQTAEYFARSCNIPWEKVVVNPEIYEAPYQKLLDVVYAVDERYSNIILVGHMPGLTQLVNYLTNDNLSYSPTCSVMEVGF